MRIYFPVLLVFNYLLNTPPSPNSLPIQPMFKQITGRLVIRNGFIYQ